MSIRAGASLAVLLAVPALLPAAPPDLSRTHTQPRPPSQAALDRLNLQTAWRRYVPMSGQRDGLATVQIDGKDLLVQTRSGTVLLLDAETGVARWRTRVGRPYQVERLLAFNSRSVFVMNSGYLFSLDRDTGTVQWEYRLPGGASAPPVAGEEQIFISSATGRLHAYYLPLGSLAVSPPTRGVSGTPAPAPADRSSMPSQRPTDLYAGGKKTTGAIGHLSSVRGAGAEAPTGPVPVQTWESMTNLRLEQVPVLTRQFVLAVSPTGTVAAFAKLLHEGVRSPEVFRFEIGDTVTAPMGHFGNVAYIGAHDSNLYALDVGVAGNLPTGKLRWRYTAGAPITRAPVALDNDVYVTSADSGLARVDRATGEALWKVPHGGRLFNSNPAADRFIAANPKFVYAMDPRGRLLVLDRRLGTTLSAYDVRDFVFPITNQQNDRLYLAANDGLLVCLHDRDYATPFDQRTREEAVSEALKKLLAQPVTVTEPRETSLRELLDDYKRRYKLSYEIVEQAFKLAGLEPVGGKMVKPPAVKDVPLGTLLREILRQVGADYQMFEDTILVLPSRKQPAPAAPLPAPGEERKP